MKYTIKFRNITGLTFLGAKASPLKRSPANDHAGMQKLTKFFKWTDPNQSAGIMEIDEEDVTTGNALLEEHPNPVSQAATGPGFGSQIEEIQSVPGDNQSGLFMISQFPSQAPANPSFGSQPFSPVGFGHKDASAFLGQSCSGRIAGDSLLDDEFRLDFNLDTDDGQNLENIPENRRNSPGFSSQYQAPIIPCANNAATGEDSRISGNDPSIQVSGNYLQDFLSFWSFCFSLL